MEHAVQFGAHQNLSGIFNDAQSEPHNGGSEPCDTAIIMVTPGMLHHAGPFRLHVDLAKSLAVQHLPSFRFDLSGIGESFGIGAGGRSLDRAVGEIRTAIDWLNENHSIRRVILFGLCSGADDGLAAAVNDPRIVGLVAMDGCGYRTPGYYWHRMIHRYLRRSLDARKWRSWIRRRFMSAPDSPASLQPGDDIREFPSRATAASQIAHLLDQGTQFHFLYTGGVSDYFNHAGQFSAMFPELAGASGVTSQYWPEIDHVAYLCEDRQRLVRHVTDCVMEMERQGRLSGFASQTHHV
ncbi:serine aminopeptidase domain-containing protein [Neorhodopirellula pilleata]|uniref:Alpha/beta hydrolase family protein n=1 Tax=Neorhodopirellula pilleata TaxID=2714738 RepID=A0A5C6AUQ5_9BACT|nr:alpha/beta hydrolase [Neorhodopirellula pilleata]TWU03318.1 Alpha/beta hydrolase family protein [Neorhodopirellula pilleata]